MSLADRIKSVLENKVLPISTEADCQRAIADVFKDNGIFYLREFVLGPRNRIDFMCDEGVGVEVKLNGTATKIARQLLRYELSDKIEHLILVTAKAVFPDPLLVKKPFTNIWLSKSWL